jgi:hypothetical protein
MLQVFMELVASSQKAVVEKEDISSMVKAKGLWNVMLP